jgi:hypothetical protein
MITLEGLLKVIASEKVITVNLYSENDLLLITFRLPGYDYLDDFLLDDEVLKLEITNLYNINVKIDTSND